jgi:cell fate (sporulation/competence/biofilm development) regulator YlbF (YheA/YmcA/DUF963 family)
MADKIDPNVQHYETAKSLEKSHSQTEEISNLEEKEEAVKTTKVVKEIQILL